MRSICFFMVYHKRPALTKMSIDDMESAMRYFSGEGHSVRGIVIGGSYDIAKFCDDRGITHFMFGNDPISDKFSYAWFRAAQAGCDYIAWWGSNNVHGHGYLVKCNEVLMGPKVATFGTKNCVIMSTGSDETCVFRPRDHYLISSGQFFLTQSIRESVNVLTVYDRSQRFNFDGVILDSMTDRWGLGIIQEVTFDEEDCIDIKDGMNIHSYDSYMRVAQYDRYDSRSEIHPRHPSLTQYLESGFD